MSMIVNQYKEKVVPELIKTFSYKNKMEAPKLEKIVLNIGLGSAKDNPKSMEIALEELTMITGQKPIVNRAKKSISNFKLREGMAIGCSVTLRKQKMYDFFERLVNIAIPRIRDFQGLKSNAFDINGNYNLGLNEQYIFPEVNLDKSDKTRGMNITFVLSKKSVEENREMLRLMGMPFKKKK